MSWVMKRKMPIVFIRHSNDDDSDPTYSHDPKITESGRKKARSTAFELVQKYGCPKIIFCSPFRRTMQRAKMMNKMFGSKTKIYIDKNLSRYFCAREKADPQIDPGTCRYDTPIYECWKGFEYRIDKHLEMIKKNNFMQSADVFWCITHALVYKHVARTYSITIPSYIPFMHYFILNENAEAVSKSKRNSHRHKKKKRHRKKDVYTRKLSGS